MVHDITYTGPSMNPTLRAGDGLRVLPYGNKRIRPGDVVVFQDPETKRHVVHRIITIDSAGARARGDNNSRIDPWILKPEDIIGRVISVKRDNRRVTIHGGARGRITVFFVRQLKGMDLEVRRIFHPAYHMLAESGIFRKCLRIFPKTRILSFSGPKGREYQLLMGNRIIGQRLPTNDRWKIVRPFKLFVDEADLPE